MLRPPPRCLSDISARIIKKVFDRIDVHGRRSSLSCFLQASPPRSPPLRFTLFPPPLHGITTAVSQIIDKVADELDDDMRKIDEASLENVKVTISPALSPKGEELQREIHVLD